MSSRRLQPIIRELVSRARKQFLTPELSKSLPILKKKKPRFLKGVYNGNYFRLSLKPKVEPRFKVPKLPPPPINDAPKAFKSIPNPESLQETSIASQIYAFLVENWGVLFLNFGSICTLIGFSRSDVIELRSLSMIGSLSSVLFQLSLRDRRWPPILWSLLFASVNATKISQILFERNAQVVLSNADQQVYMEFFLPHGLTPKQFELVMRSATPVSFPNGGAILRQGQTMDHVFLIVQGSTRAHVLGRHLSAVSSDQKKKVEYLGGDSGAWIGEMAFLTYCWEREQRKNKMALDSNDNTAKDKNDIGNDKTKVNGKIVPGSHAAKSLYTVIATEDCKLLRWSFDEMESLFSRSSDMRGALTRAMTSAIVGKVINFTVPRKNIKSSWASWLEDFAYNGSRTSIVKSQLVEDLTPNDIVQPR